MVAGASGRGSSATTAAAIRQLVQHLNERGIDSGRSPEQALSHSPLPPPPPPSAVAIQMSRRRDLVQNRCTGSAGGAACTRVEAWSDGETARLLEAAHYFQYRQWNKIAECVGSRSEDACRHRYFTVLKTDPDRVEAAALMQQFLLDEMDNGNGP